MAKDNETLRFQFSFVGAIVLKGHETIVAIDELTKEFGIFL